LPLTAVCFDVCTRRWVYNKLMCTVR